MSVRRASATGHGVRLLAWLLAAAPLRAQSPSEGELIALFPRPPATVAARVDADFGGTDRPQTAVLFDTSLPGRWRLGVVLADEHGRWVLPTWTLKTLPGEGPFGLEARHLRGPRASDIVVRGSGPGDHWTYRVLALQAGTLPALLDLAGQGTPPTETDLDADERSEVVVEQNQPLGAPDWELVDFGLIGWRWQGARFSACRWRVPDDAWQPREAVGKRSERVAQLAEAHLWTQAQAAAEEAQRLAPEPANAWNKLLVGRLAHRFRAQAAAAANRAPLERAVAQALAGDYDQAGRSLLAIPGQAALPAGWCAPVMRLHTLVDQGFAAVPDLNRSPAALLIRGLVALATDNEPGARVSFQRARALDPQLKGIGAWQSVGAAAWRLWFLGSGQLVHAVDLTLLGRPLGGVRSYHSWGAVRSLAASPASPTLAWVPRAGDRVVAAEDDDKARELLRGKLLSLTPAAFSPDGRLLAVDEGASVLRQLKLVRPDSGKVEAELHYAGAYAWSPNAQRLAVELPRKVEPPFPWEDGGTRDIAAVDRRGREVKRLAAGDATTLWSLQGWPTPAAILARRQRLSREADGGVLPQEAKLLTLDPESGEATPAALPSDGERDAELVMRRLRLDIPFEVTPDVRVPGLVLYRQFGKAGATLWVLRRDGLGEPRRLGPAPGADSPFVATLGKAADSWLR